MHLRCIIYSTDNNIYKLTATRGSCNTMAAPATLVFCGPRVHQIVGDEWDPSQLKIFSRLSIGCFVSKDIHA